MKNSVKGLLPPDFCDLLTVYKRGSDGVYRAQYVRRCKFSKEKAEYSGDILGGANYSFYARLPLGECEIVPGDILVKGKVLGSFKKEENGEDILKKYPHAAFRAGKISFCGNHIYVKG